MSKLNFSKTPLFIPKVQDKNIGNWGLKLPAIFVNSMTLEWRPSVKSISNYAEIMIVDPVTDRILSSEAKKKKSFKKLGYPDVEPEELYSDVSMRHELIEKCIKNQIKNNAGILIAPYLYAEDTDDTKFVTNLTLLSETINYIKENNITTPLSAMICIGNTVLNRPLVLNHIIDRYNDDYSEYLSGFFLSINDFNGRKTTDLDQLIGLAHFVYRLSEYKPVIIKRIDSFGEILCAIGATAYSSGLASSETYSLKNQDDTPRRPPKRIYAPEIFDYLNDEEAKKIDYKCHPLTTQNNKHPKDTPTKQYHYLLHKLDRLKKMESLIIDLRIDYMIRELDKAKKLSNNWSDKFGIPPKFQHYNRWKAVLEKAKFWKPSRQDDEELQKLLEELEND